MPPAFRPLRFLAAALAVLGLFARPLQAVVNCPMPADDALVSVQQKEQALHAGHARPTDHADHASHGQPQAAPQTAEAPASLEAPVSSDTPQSSDERCPDLAHCAVAAPIAERDVAGEDARPEGERVELVHARPASIIASLEPPPPKAR